jgi:hypothetical protein
VEGFLNNSKCATNIEQKKFLTMLIGNNSTTLLYNASADGWTSFDFHARCDRKGPTISLFKIKDGDCIGGYTSDFWYPVPPMQNRPYGGGDAILFNLDKCRYFNQ